MDREAGLREAFEWISWQGEDFEIESGDLWRLRTAIISSVETVAVHSLDRVHKWLWPVVEKTPLGEAFEFGPALFTVVERLPAQDREESKIGVRVDVGVRSWKLAWFDMEGREAHLGIGVRNDEHYLGYEPAAYCEFGERSYYKGGLNATGDDVGEMFDLFAILRPFVPAALLAIRDGTHNDWRLDGAEGILELDGGIGGDAATELHRMAEQFACARVFDWARDRILQAHDFLGDRGVWLGEAAVGCSDGNRRATSVETYHASRIAFVESQFPHRDLFDRYLTVADLGEDGQPTLVSVYALQQDDTVGDVVERVNEGVLAPTVSHDYRNSITNFAPGRSGFLHVSHFANSVALISNLANLSPDAEGEEFEIVRDDLRNEP